MYYDHGDPMDNNVGKIVSSIEQDYGRKDGLSQLDIAIVDQSNDHVLALVEIEETTDRPKTLMGDLFGVLFGEYLSFKRKTLKVGLFTTLLVTGIGDAAFEQRNQHILRVAEKAKASLGTKNSEIGTLIMRVFSNGDELLAGVPLELVTIVKRGLAAAAS